MYFSVIFFSFFRVTSLPMQRGETASCRGSDKNTSASSSNTTTLATTNTIKTHTDRYINSGMQSFSCAVFNHLFFNELLQNLSDS